MSELTLLEALTQLQSLAVIAAPEAWDKVLSELDRRGKVIVKAEALVNKMDVVHKDSGYRGTWEIAYAHGHRYTGPQYDVELAALTEALGK